MLAAAESRVLQKHRTCGDRTQADGERAGGRGFAVFSAEVTRNTIIAFDFEER